MTALPTEAYSIHAVNSKGNRRRRKVEPRRRTHSQNGVLKSASGFEIPLLLAPAGVEHARATSPPIAQPRFPDAQMQHSHSSLDLSQYPFDDDHSFTMPQIGDAHHGNFSNEWETNLYNGLTADLASHSDQQLSGSQLLQQDQRTMYRREQPTSVDPKLLQRQPHQPHALLQRNELGDQRPVDHQQDRSPGGTGQSNVDLDGMNPAISWLDNPPHIQQDRE